MEVKKLEWSDFPAERASVTKEGLARFIVNKVDQDTGQYAHGIEVWQADGFSFGLLSDGKYFRDSVKEILREMPLEETLAPEIKDAPLGVYEIIGEVWYEYDPGENTPNGPAEPDAWWEFRDVKFAPVDPEMAKYLEPKNE